MSLLLFIFYWIGIPAFVIWLAWVFWRKSETTVGRALIVVSGIAVLLVLLWLAAGEKWWLDYQVRKLCAVDGGIRVYETVRLPAEKFNKYGQINFYRPIDGENALGPEYIFKEEDHYYKYGNPEFLREHQEIFRRSDGNLIGEGIIYVRRGGDLPGPWHRTWYTCPDRKDMDLIEQVFVSSGKE